MQTQLKMGNKKMKHSLILVTLNQDQSKKAKEINGHRKTMTHALLCGPHGQIFGTEKYCRKYYSVWSRIFPYVFDKSIEVSEYDILNFETTFNLVNKLFETNDPLEKEDNPAYQKFLKFKKQLESEKPKNIEKRSFLSRIFGEK